MVAAAVQQAFTAKQTAVARQSRSRVVRVAAVQQQEPAAPLRFLAAGVAAAAVATCGSPAQAGVVLVQPEVKNFVKDTPGAASSSSGSKAAPAAKKAAAPKKEESGSSGVGFEAFRPLIFPLSLLAIGGAGVAASKADPKFAELLAGDWSAKDSNSVGAGYETAPGLKDTPFFGGSGSAAPAKAAPKAAPKKTGTTKVSKKGGSIFGSR